MSIEKRVATRFAAMQDSLEERIGQTDDAKKAIDDILEELEKDPDGELDKPIEVAREIQDNLDTAQSVESEEDFDVAVKEAHKLCAELDRELKDAKNLAKREKLKDTIEVIGEAASTLKQLRREIEDLLPES